MKALLSFEMFGYTCPTTECHIPDILYLLHYHAANFILLADDNGLTFIRFKFKYNRSVVVYSDAVQIFSRCFVFDVACLIIDKSFVVNLSVCLYLHYFSKYFVECIGFCMWTFILKSDTAGFWSLYKLRLLFDVYQPKLNCVPILPSL